MQIIKDNIANIIKYPAFMSGQTPGSITQVKDHVLGMLATGGAYSTWVSDSVISNLHSHDGRYRLKKGYHIVLYEDIVDQLTPLQLNALIGHERAHILLGHIPRVEDALEEGETVRIINNIEYELHADWCSARVNGKAPLREGIAAMLAASSLLAARVGILRGKIPASRETGFASELLEKAMKEETIVTRLKALS